jgi:hypothetical protein
MHPLFTNHYCRRRGDKVIYSAISIGFTDQWPSGHRVIRVHIYRDLLDLALPDEKLLMPDRDLHPSTGQEIRVYVRACAY